jgi:hypothetical protein
MQISQGKMMVVETATEISPLDHENFSKHQFGLMQILII